MPKISDLTAVTTAQVNPDVDTLPIVDVSAGATRKLTVRSIVDSALAVGNFSFDGTNTRDVSFSNVDDLMLDGAITTLRGETAVRIVTQAVRLGTATAGQVPKLTDEDEGTIEFSSLDALSVGTGATLQTANLRAWTGAQAFTVTSATRDTDGVITTATVSWPDGSAGTFTTVTKNSTFLTIDAFTVSHNSSGKTVTQAAVTRDASGNVTAQPALTITP